MAIEAVGVIGGGVMGSGIAQALAVADAGSPSAT
jgi:3-hydroxyacyl-CoA dehydrogenase